MQAVTWTDVLASDFGVRGMTDRERQIWEDEFSANGRTPPRPGELLACLRWRADHPDPACRRPTRADLGNWLIEYRREAAWQRRREEDPGSADTLTCRFCGGSGWATVGLIEAHGQAAIVTPWKPGEPSGAVCCCCCAGDTNAARCIQRSRDPQAAPKMAAIRAAAKRMLMTGEPSAVETAGVRPFEPVGAGADGKRPWYEES